MFASKPLPAEEVKSVTQGRSWRNTLVVIGPKRDVGRDLLEDDDLRMAIARASVAGHWSVPSDRKGELQKLTGDFQRKLDADVKDKYGEWYKVVRRGAAEPDIREIPVEPSETKIEEVLARHYDISAIKAAIREHLAERAQEGCKLRELGEGFRMRLGWPIVKSDEDWQRAVRALVDPDREVVVRAGRTLYPYQGVLPAVLQVEWEAWLKEFAPPPPPPPGVKESVERNLRYAREDGLLLPGLLEKVRDEGVMELSAEGLRQALEELVAEGKATAEDTQGDVRSPEGGDVPSALGLHELRAWHREFAPADDRSARQRVMQILAEKGEVPLGLLSRALQEERIATGGLERALQRLVAQDRIHIIGPQGRIRDRPLQLTDDYRAKLPEEIPPPEWEREITVDTGVCGSPDMMLSLLRERILDEALIVSLEVSAEPAAMAADPPFQP